MSNKWYRRNYPDYGWRHHNHGHHHGRYHHRYGHGPYYGYDYGSYWYDKPKYDYWQPKYYRTGGNAWWKRMDREGRGGQQE